jgi:hypothetical protein
MILPQSQFPDISYEGWVGFELVLPRGFRHVASVERPDVSGNCCGHGEVWDLGQNAEGKFRLFRRLAGIMENSHDPRGEPLGPVDLAGFGLTDSQNAYESDELMEYGDFSSLCKSNLILGVS